MSKMAPSRHSRRCAVKRCYFQYCPAKALQIQSATDTTARCTGTGTRLKLILVMAVGCQTAGPIGAYHFISSLRVRMGKKEYEPGLLGLLHPIRAIAQPKLRRHLLLAFGQGSVAPLRCLAPTRMSASQPCGRAEVTQDSQPVIAALTKSPTFQPFQIR